MSRKNLTKIGKSLGIGERIREIRGSLSQTEFGKILGVKAATISRWEAGRLPDEDTRKRIAEIGKTTEEYLLYGEKRSPPRLQEHAPEIYEARPAMLNIDDLVRAKVLCRRYLKARRLTFTDHQEAQLSAYIYEYLNEYHEDPGEVVIRRLADLIKRQKEEG